MVLTAYPFIILAASVVASFTIEGLSWLLVYRTANFKRLQSELDRSSRKLEVIKAAPSTATKKDKKQTRLEDQLKSTSQQLNATRFRTGLITSGLLLLLYRLITTALDGVVVAKLPFEPPGFMQKVTHAGLMGSDITDCSAAFMYVVGAVGIRTNVQKLMGFAPSRAAAKLAAANPLGIDTSKYK